MACQAIPTGTSPHVSERSLQILFEVDTPNQEFPEYRDVLRYWGNDSFQKTVVPIDGEEEDIYLAQAVRLGAGSPVMMRLEYLELWRELRTEPLGFHGAICGQPGSGKSFSLHAMTSICTEKRIPFARYELGQQHAVVVLDIDTDQGPQPRLFTVPYSNLAKLAFLHENYIFLDMSDSSATVPGEFHSACLASKVILATSPRGAQHRGWLKEREVQFAVMKPCSQEELQAMHHVRRHLPPSVTTSFANIRPLSKSGFPEGGYSAKQILKDLKEPVDADGLWSIYVTLHTIGPDPRSVLSSFVRRKQTESYEDDLLRGVKAMALFSNAYEASAYLEGIRPNASPAKGYHRLFYEIPAPTTPSPHFQNSWIRFSRPAEAITTIPTDPLRSFLRQAVTDELTNRTFDLLGMLTGTGSPHGVVFEEAGKFLLSTQITMKLNLVGKEPIVLNLAATDPIFPPSWDPDDLQAPVPTEKGLYHLPKGFASADAFLIATSSKPVSLSTLSNCRLLRNAISRPFSALSLGGFPNDLVLQMTIARHHSIVGKEALSIRRGVARRPIDGDRERPLVFVFVVPDDAKGAALASTAGSTPGYDEVGWIVLNGKTIKIT
ncbi:hypothetical protein JCM11251_000039 [Rhodosporidiobolus azoricus]